MKILLADDHHLFRQGLRRILESQPDFEVVAEAASGLEASWGEAPLRSLRPGRSDGSDRLAGSISCRTALPCLG